MTVVWGVFDPQCALKWGGQIPTWGYARTPGGTKPPHFGGTAPHPLVGGGRPVSAVMQDGSTPPGWTSAPPGLREAAPTPF